MFDWDIGGNSLWRGTVVSELKTLKKQTYVKVCVIWSKCKA